MQDDDRTAVVVWKNTVYESVGGGVILIKDFAAGMGWSRSSMILRSVSRDKPRLLFRRFAPAADGVEALGAVMEYDTRGQHTTREAVRGA